MELPEKIDLHLHSTVSDGTDTPAELLAKVRSAGLELFALTDHDAFKGCAAVRALRKEGDPAFLNGVEFSCQDGTGKYHILGYAFDPKTEPIRRVVETGHGFRMTKALARLDFLASRFGFRFPKEEVRALLALDNPGKPHIGNLMVKYGYAKSKELAIRKYVDQLKFEAGYVAPEEAISGILGSGGIPVLAHPVFGSGEELILGEELDRRIRRLADCGLAGVEAFYSGFSAEQRDEVLSLAEKYGLYVTAGSDYHGNNKQVVLGDTGLGAASGRPEGLRRFLETVLEKRG